MDTKFTFCEYDVHEKSEMIIKRKFFLNPRNWSISTTFRDIVGSPRMKETEITEKMLAVKSIT